MDTSGRKSHLYQQLAGKRLRLGWVRFSDEWCFKFRPRISQVSPSTTTEGIIG